MNGHVDMVLLLLKAGANVAYLNQYFESAVHIASQRGYHECLVVLLRYAQLDPSVDLQSVLNAININGHSALHLACELDNLSIVQTLLDFGADAWLTNDVCILNCPIHLAARYGHVDNILVLMADAGAAYAEVKDGYGRTPLSTAAERNQLAVVEALLGLGVSPDPVADRRLCTPAHWAAKHNNVEMLTLLHLAGANLQIRDNIVGGIMTPLDVARRYQCQEAIRYLEGL
eukprot:m.49944 g.49944  ORF g.49944 m.49944 type:complete len:230 (+) comp13380_c0_seq1:1-690(+)